MVIRIAAFANCDDACVFWRIETPIKSCLGFALEREIKDDKGDITRTVVENRTGFATEPGKPGEHRPSTEWPFQRFSWSDHQMDIGHTVRYRVTPVIEATVPGTPIGTLALGIEERSAWTPWITLSGNVGGGFACYYNRGLVMSQFMSRYIADIQRREGVTFTKALAIFKQSLANHETPIRLFLSGELRKALLESAGVGTGHIFAALYELEDEELVRALTKLRGRAHVVLANGSVKKKGEDQNRKARKALKKAGVEVIDRNVAPSALGHNKFLVLCNSKKSPKAVWTGSTNWTKTGLCTQINNGLLITNAAAAGEYRAQWDRLRAAGSAFPPSLASDNSKVKKVTIKGKKTDIWFTRTRGGSDLDALAEVLDSAKEAILFLMFIPGPTGTYSAVKKILDQRGDRLYIHGVATELPKPDAKRADVTILSSSAHRGGLVQKLDGLRVLEPTGIKAPFASWAATVTKGQFKSSIGHAIVHSKLIVVDPFTKPVVVTGSHNFSSAASKTNDENFVIVHGHEKLALAYATHIKTVYNHYRWLKYVSVSQASGKSPWSGLADDDDWQTGHLKGRSRQEMLFWVR